MTTVVKYAAMIGDKFVAKGIDNSNIKLKDVPSASSFVDYTGNKEAALKRLYQTIDNSTRYAQRSLDSYSDLSRYQVGRNGVTQEWLDISIEEGKEWLAKVEKERDENKAALRIVKVTYEEL